MLTEQMNKYICYKVCAYNLPLTPIAKHSRGIRTTQRGPVLLLRRYGIQAINQPGIEQVLDGNLDQIRQEEADALPVAMEEVGQPREPCVFVPVNGEEFRDHVIVHDNVGRKEEDVAETGGRAKSHELRDGRVPCVEEFGADGAGGGRA